MQPGRRLSQSPSWLPRSKFNTAGPSLRRAGCRLERGALVVEYRSFTEIGVAALVIVICAVFLIQAVALPAGTFEPLGSGEMG